jgi:hypothetical protein
MPFIYTKKPLYSWLYTFSYLTTIVFAVYGFLFWFSFMLYLFLKEFAYESSFEVHNFFVQQFFFNPGLVLVCVICPMWIFLLWELSKDYLQASIEYKKNGDD